VVVCSSSVWAQWLGHIGGGGTLAWVLAISKPHPHGHNGMATLGMAAITWASPWTHKRGRNGMAAMAWPHWWTWSQWRGRACVVFIRHDGRNGRIGSAGIGDFGKCGVHISQVGNLCKPS